MSQHDLQAVKGWRVTQDDYPGALCALGGGFRLAVAMNGSAYLLQQSGQAVTGETIWPRQYRGGTLAALIERHGEKSAALRDLVGVFPDDPREAAPHVREAVERLQSRFAETDWRRDDYARVICQDGNLRLAVDPEGVEYRLQWVSTGGFLADEKQSWLTLRKSPELEVIRDYVETFVFSIIPEQERACPRLKAAFSSLPEMAVYGQWPYLPERP